MSIANLRTASLQLRPPSTPTTARLDSNAMDQPRFRATV